MNMKKIFFFVVAAFASLTMMAETPANLYILGDITGLGWQPGTSWAMTKTGDTFSGKYTFNNESGTAYFCFATVQGSWEEVNANRYGTMAIISPESAGTLTNEGEQPCATIANGTYTITVDWATMTVTAVVDTPDPAPEAPDHLYILGNLKDLNWDVTNKLELTKNGTTYTGTYTFVADETAYFCFTTTSSTSWDDINAARYGTDAILNPTANLIKGGDGTCGTVAPGTYLITVDWDKMTVTASASTGLQQTTTYTLPIKVMQNGKVMIRSGKQMIAIDGKQL